MQRKKEEKAKQKKKLSFKEAAELKELPALIETMEEEQQTIHDKMANPEFYKNKDEIVSLKEQLTKLESQLAIDYERWEYLESIVHFT